jgi:hypothetical protein
VLGLCIIVFLRSDFVHVDIRLRESMHFRIKDLDVPMETIRHQFSVFPSLVRHNLIVPDHHVPGTRLPKVKVNAVCGQKA